MPRALRPQTDRKIELFRILSVLGESRNRLVADFVSEKPALYHAMFAYERGSVDMDLALTRYFFFWLDSLPDIYEELYLFGEDSLSEQEDFFFERFLESYRRFCECFVLDRDLSSGRTLKDSAHPAIESLLKKKIQILGELLKISQKSDERMKKLRYQTTKSIALFDRQLSELGVQQNDNSST